MGPHVGNIEAATVHPLKTETNYYPLCKARLSASMLTWGTQRMHPAAIFPSAQLCSGVVVMPIGSCGSSGTMKLKFTNVMWEVCSRYI